MVTDLMLGKALGRWVVIGETERKVVKLMEIKGPRRRKRPGKEGNRLRLRRAELELPDAHHWALETRSGAPENSHGRHLIFSHVYR